MSEVIARGRVTLVEMPRDLQENLQAWGSFLTRMPPVWEVFFDLPGGRTVQVVFDTDELYEEQPGCWFFEGYIPSVPIVLSRVLNFDPGPAAEVVGYADARLPGFCWLTGAI